ncbi:UL47 tegument protein/IE transactivator [Leporid alphaherpesvirus 4]|uniref:Tegument protein UL47 n=1 Tax=Leporid alphaherpesvirus 4 TaxID=481315 RepID=J9QVD7_9ALPH|nr:UL47 tegument protein/IE transactivator [Leporid alphaherpesvirus 4]AFR32490.1 UL47 tegument protein/IE transactivator [Leporid alphaherpesvirus 4]
MTMRRSISTRRRDMYGGDVPPHAREPGIVDWFQTVFNGDASPHVEGGTTRRRRLADPYDDFEAPAPRRSRHRSGRGASRGAPLPEPGYLGALDARDVLEHLEPRFAPSALFLRELENEEPDYMTMADHRPAEPSQFSLDALAGLLKGRRALDVLPLDRLYPRVEPWDEAARAALALGNPAVLYSCPLRAFGLARAGVMHFASPRDPRVFFSQTLHQAAELAWRITGDSFMSGAAGIPAAKKLAFLADALVRLAINCQASGNRIHTDSDNSANPHINELRRQFASVTVMRPMSAAAVPLFATAGGSMSPQSGPDAALLRSSLGSMAYCSELRTYLDRDCRVAVRYAARMTYVATAALLSRFNPAAVGSIITREAAFLGRVFDVLAVMAEQTAQWVAFAIGGSAHPGSTHQALMDIGTEDLFRKLPLGSVGVLTAEAEALGDRGAKELIASSGLNAVLTAAVVALETALTTAMLKYARARGDARSGSMSSAERGATRALLAVGMLLQRLLGFSDAVVACLAAAAFDGGMAAVEVGAYTPLRYACVLRIARPLYSRNTPSDFWGAVREASERMDLRPARSTPPPSLSRTVSPEFLEEDIQMFPPQQADFVSVLGPRVRAIDSIDQFRRLLMGADAASALAEHTAGRPARGMPPRPRPRSSA